MSASINMCKIIIISFEHVAAAMDTLNITQNTPQAFWNWREYICACCVAVLLIQLNIPCGIAYRSI